MPKITGRIWKNFRKRDGVAHYWTFMTLFGSVVSIGVLPFDFQFLDAPAWIPVVVRVFGAACLAFGATLPSIFKKSFSTRIFPFALLAVAVLMASSISFLEMFARQTMYYNGLYQLFVAFAFVRVSFLMAVTIYALPVVLYRLIAGAENFDVAQPEILLLTLVGFAVNQGIRAADARRMQKANHDTLVLWARSSAHELKGPLIAIRMLAHDLLDDEDTERHTREAVAEIKKLCDRGLAVQNRMLINARYQAPEQSELAPMYAGETIQRAISEYEFRTPGQETLISTEIDPDFEFNGDSILFINVLHNLFANALRAIAAAGSGEIQISVGIVEEMGRIVCRDTGSGIEPDKLPFVFDPGVTFAGGTGFGLAFCKAVVESFSGTITCVSDINESTTFTILLPLN